MEPLGHDRSAIGCHPFDGDVERLGDVGDDLTERARLVEAAPENGGRPIKEMASSRGSTTTTSSSTTVQDGVAPGDDVVRADTEGTAHVRTVVDRHHGRG